MKNMYDLYQRSYTKIQDVLANVGGIVEAYIIIAKCLNFFAHDFQIIYNTFNVLVYNKIRFDQNLRLISYKNELRSRNNLVNIDYEKIGQNTGYVGVLTKDKTDRQFKGIEKQIENIDEIKR